MFHSRGSGGPSGGNSIRKSIQTGLGKDHTCERTELPRRFRRGRGETKPFVLSGEEDRGEEGPSPPPPPSPPPSLSPFTKSAQRRPESSGESEAKRPDQTPESSGGISAMREEVRK